MKCNYQAAETIALSVVLPFHNEQSSLALVVSGLAEVLEGSGIQHEIILVDDGSSDESVASLGKIVSENPRIRLCSHPARRGSGFSRKSGMREAKGEWIAWIDGDITYEPKDLLLLWNCRNTNTQLIGRRPAEQGLRRLPRRMAKAFFCLMASALWFRWLPDLNSGLRLMPTKEVRLWMHHMPDGFSCATVATLASLRFGQNLQFIPISYGSRHPFSKSKFRPAADSIRLFCQILQIRFCKCNRP